MLHFLANKVADGAGGYIYKLTGGGYALLIIVLVAIVGGIAFINRNRKRKQIHSKQMVFAALSIALAVVTSYLKIFKMPMGGSITLLSMFFICLIGYWYGLRIGIMTAVSYGLLQLILDPYIVSLPQMLIDYIFAFGALGLSGLFSNKKNGMILGFLTGVFGRFLFSTLSGIIFFAAYAPEGMDPAVYAALYNGSYMGAEAVITVIVLALPAVARAMVQVKEMAQSE